MKRIHILATLFALMPSIAFADDSKSSDTAQVINHAIDKASDGLTQIAHALSSAAPQAWAMACKGVFAYGMSGLVVAGICGTLFVTMAACTVGFAIAAVRRFDKDSNSELGGWFAGCSVVSALIGLSMLIGTMVNGLNSDNWARVISPDGYLAQSILTKALGSN